jgi:hypothetical protein
MDDPVMETDLLHVGPIGIVMKARLEITVRALRVQRKHILHGLHVLRLVTHEYRLEQIIVEIFILKIVIHSPVIDL